jgi:general secretion pathway protein F
MRFSIRFLDPEKGVQHIEYDAPTQEQAIQYIQRAGQVVLNIQPIRQAMWKNTSMDVQVFCEELLSLLQAGLNVSEALQALNKQVQQQGLQHLRAKVITHLYQSLQEGQRFSEALRSAAVFPDLLIASVEASESTGGVQDALRRFVALEAERRQLKDALIAGSIYPVLVLGIGGIVILFLLFHVVPRFAAIFTQMDKALPWSTRLLLDWGNIVHAHPEWLMGGVIVLISAVVMVFMVKRVQTWLLTVVCRWPQLYKKLSQFQCARFYRGLALLLNGGIPLPKALLLARGLLSLPKLQQAWSETMTSIERGERVSAVLYRTALIDTIGEQLISAAEGRGQLASSLEHLAVWTEQDLRRTTARMLRVLEPLLMLMVGSLIGLIVLLMYVPLFELTGSLL